MCVAGNRMLPPLMSQGIVGRSVHRCFVHVLFCLVPLL